MGEEEIGEETQYGGTANKDEDSETNMRVKDGDDVEDAESNRESEDSEELEEEYATYFGRDRA